MIVRHLLDERHAAGGRVKSWVFLTHPGPSLLVTAVTVATAEVVARGQLPSGTVASLIAVMLPMQLGIGALNDWADVAADRAAKPFKPVARGRVPRGAALLFAIVAFALSLAAATLWSTTYLLIDLVGVLSGAAYDLGLKRTPLSVLCFWGGLECVALLATTTAGAGAGGAVLTAPLSALLAFALHVSNALPDIDGDRSAGAVTVPVALGSRAARAAAAAALALAAAYAGGVTAVRHLGGGAVLATAAVALAGLLGALTPAPRLRRAGFPAMALLAGVAAVAWLSAVAHPGR